MTMEELEDVNLRRRQRLAMARLRKAGLFRLAQKWLAKNPPPEDFQGTGLEWAELEMNVPLARLMDFCGFF